MSKLPLIIAGTNCLSGVTTWAEQLRDALADHPRYRVQLLYVGPERPADFDLYAPTNEAALQLVCELAPAVLIPNYLWELFVVGFEPDIHCVGMCHADSDEQYYTPLSWYEPMIAQFVAVSPECIARLAERVPCRATEIAMLPYGISVPRGLNRSYQTQPLRLIYAGRVTQLQKRVWDFVPLLKNLFAASVPFQFDIVGEGDHYAGLKDEIQDRFPAGYVRFHPRLPFREMPSLWTTHDVFVQVSDFEGTSVSMLEAMAHGAVPVVTAASSGINGVIRHGENGFVVPVGDMQAMAEVLARLAHDRMLLESAGRAAHGTAQAYSMDKYSGKFTDILDQMIERGEEVDLYRRYGMFGYAHPAWKQRELIEEQRREIAQLQQGAIQRLLGKGYQRLSVSKVWRHVGKKRLNRQQQFASELSQ